MRVVSLEPFITDVLDFIGAGSAIAGLDHRSKRPDACPAASVLTAARSRSPDATESRLMQGLSSELLDLDALILAAPDVVLISSTERDGEAFARFAVGELRKLTGKTLRVESCTVRTLDGMYSVFEHIGESVGKSREGRELAHRVKAQLMDWSDNFHQRTRNKRVTVLSSVSPLRLAGGWVPDLVRGGSGAAQHFAAGEDDKDVSWEEISRFRPDVIIVAPRDYTLEESVRTLRFFERVPEWEGIPGVKRGEVIFADGFSLYSPGPRFLNGAAVIVSAMAGLESGYITKRDEFFRLRFVELHRHRFS